MATTKDYVLVNFDKSGAYHITKTNLLNSKKLVIIRDGGVSAGFKIVNTFIPYAEYVSLKTEYVKNNKVLGIDRSKLTIGKAYEHIKEITGDGKYCLKNNVIVLQYPKKRGTFYGN